MADASIIQTRSKDLAVAPRRLEASWIEEKAQRELLEQRVNDGLNSIQNAMERNQDLIQAQFKAITEQVQLLNQSKSILGCGGLIPVNTLSSTHMSLESHYTATHNINICTPPKMSSTNVKIRFRKDLVKEYT
ncbi:unnamed protein product [Cuscuta campestris]|uniref:Uncharacterized protein n=1 Tax=Cuscuta campestris TaxID=132261 RepID=A0A484MJU6_9ASTE|nr:unnamed protein product [Cuscuta campestris]